MKIKKIIAFMLFLLTHKHLVSQNFISKFYTSPLIINPANTGKFLGDYRIRGVYRNEKNAISQNSKASFFYDSRILPKALPKNDRLAVGGAMLSEKDIFN